MSRRFSDVGDATRLHESIGASLVSHDSVRELVADLVRIGDRPPLVQQLAIAEFRRLAVLVNELSDGTISSCEGEDRTWLLTLTSTCRQTIDAITIVTVERGQLLIDGGPRRSDRAQRYFDAQIAALQHEDGRAMEIRRILVVERGDVTELADFVAFRNAQEAAGIKTRVWDLSTGVGREYGDSFELVIFDRAVCYLPSPAARTSHGERPVLVNTQLEIDPERVRRRVQHFERLWDALRRPARRRSP
ncbi:hypothetical protein [Phytohabitans rumicis]|uniref:DUF5753 domain-containing protein n=1 Tax=Phytohabitans rumicis TaxID=1076125 RepID=A0A6V8KSZ9_9ACTN|nr:hypothetical protein [Phytohabitans rumicis]GFJ86550.1 hypothetical protein Prum_001920 [Phytohabitans rumicis]